MRLSQRRTLSGSDLFAGALADLRIYNRSLSAAEVAALSFPLPNGPQPSCDSGLSAAAKAAAVAAAKAAAVAATAAAIAVPVVIVLLIVTAAGFVWYRRQAGNRKLARATRERCERVLASTSTPLARARCRQRHQPSTPSPWPGH